MSEGPIVQAVARAIYDHLHACGVPLRDHAALGLAHIVIRAHLAALEAEGYTITPPFRAEQIPWPGEKKS